MPRKEPSDKIETTGQLRQFLANAITKVGRGEMSTEEAQKITKLAAQINESFYSEIKIAKTKWEMGEVEKVQLGDLLID